MSDPVGVGVETVGGMFKDLVVDKIVEYVKFIKNYEENMGELREELQDLCDKKLDLEGRVMKGKQNLQVMTRQTTRWLEVVIDMIKGGEIRKLMKDEGVAEVVVKMMDRRVLKNLWKEDREVFDIVVGVVKKKCSIHQQAAAGTDDGEVVGAEEDADYNKVAKIAIDVMKDAAEEFTKFIKTDDAAAALVKLLSDEDLTKLAKKDDDMALILSKAEGINRKKIEHNDDDEEESLLPKQSEEVQQPFKRNIIKDKVSSLRKRIGSLMTFLEDEKFKKGLPDAALLGLEVMGAVSKSSGSEQAEQKGKLHRYCGWNVVRFEDYHHRHDMSLMSVTMVTDIRSMISKYPSDPVTRDRTDDELEFIPGEFVEGLESREALLRKILTALKDDKVNVVGVYGMGGCGKTTLVKELVNKRAGDLFDKRVVVEVSEAPNIKSIQDQIAGGIGLIWKDMQQSVAQRARALYNTLKSQKILIILDNVWKKLKLDEVGIPYRENNKDFFCKLLITTRDRHVCSKDMDVEEANIFELGLLNEAEALNLFENQLEKKVESEEKEFKLVADRLLRKCGGLPLAIATTASALKGKNLAMWNHFVEISEKPISSQVSSEYRETYSILETSCKLMDIEEKRMFLFLACLSPLDSAVSVEDLMRYGIGLDLFQRLNSLSDAMEQATNWANELISSSLLLGGDSDGEVRIHDLVRASTISFIDKGKDRMTLVESIPRWMCEETFEKFTAISLMSGHDFSQLSGVIAPKLEILLLKGDISSTTLPSNFFVGMKSLKVLSLSNMKFSLGLPESMRFLERLKTLHLHYCKLRDVKVIGKLVSLLVLSLRGSSLKELASEIGKLCKLRLLDMGGCKGMESIPANILSRFSYLEGLYMLNSFDGWASTTNNNIEEVIDGGGSNQQQAIICGRELDMLSHLNVLEMEVSDAKQLLTVNNDQFVQQLSKFRVRIRNSYKLDMADVSTFRYVLELELDKIDPSQSIWLKALLKKTECLLVMKCDSVFENLVPLFEGDGFNDLRYLQVVDCEFKCIVSCSNNERDDESMMTTFAKLELLHLDGLSYMEVICDGKAPTGMFSNLRKLSFRWLLYLKYGLPLTFASLNLMTEISIEFCDSLEFIVVKDASVTKNETYVDLFPQLRSLVLYYVESLSSVSWQSRNDQMFTIENDDLADHSLFSTESKYPCLEDLKLTSAHAIVTLWSKTCYVSSFQGLKVLRVESCDKLRGLGSPRIFASLVQLEHLQISSCGELQEVITKEMEEDEVGEHVIKFPSLKYLTLKYLSKLQRFYGGNYRLEFPNLKSMTLSDAQKMTNFDGSETSTTLFSDKIKFPSLVELEVRGMSNEVVSLWNWSASDVCEQNEGDSSNSSNPVPSLKQLRVIKVNDGLTSIPSFISHKLSHLEVKNFDDIKTLFSSVVVPSNRMVFWTYSQFPKLENISVGYCDSLEQLFENEDDEDAVRLCKSLIGITLDDLEALKMFPLQLFANIRTLSLSRLGWKYVFSADLFIKGKEQLQQLEKLKIRECNLEVIIMDEVIGDEEDDDRVYCFPCLKTLSLTNVSITNFASKPNIGLHFPSLERIDLSTCEKIQSFWSGPFTAPKLKKVRLSHCNLKSFLSNKVDEVVELPSLETMNLWGCSSLLSFSCEPLVTPKLQTVTCNECPKMKWFIPGNPNNGDNLELPSLESVNVIASSSLESFSSGKIKAPKLCELEVDSVDYSKRSNEDLEHLLNNLTDIIVRPAEDHNDEEQEELQADDNDGCEEEESMKTVKEENQAQDCEETESSLDKMN